jgi:hypothetical protein
VAMFTYHVGNVNGPRWLQTQLCHGATEPTISGPLPRLAGSRSTTRSILADLLEEKHGNIHSVYKRISGCLAEIKVIKCFDRVVAQFGRFQKVGQLFFERCVELFNLYTKLDSG